jgi:hypothetical protein
MRFCVLRSEWCQKWCQMESATLRIPMSLIAPRLGLGHRYRSDAVWLKRGF